MRNLFLLLISSTIFFSCNNQKEDWEDLLDEHLTQWDKYLSYRHDDSYDGSIPQTDAGRNIDPIGLNKDEYEVFKVVTENNEHVLRISGEIYGCIVTKKEYENYHLTLKVQWGKNVYPPRLKKGRDSGLLYHSIGENGADYWRSWMFSHEFQIMRGHMGDYWSIGPMAIDIRAIPEEWIMNYVANDNYPFLAVRDSIKGYGYCLRSVDYESKDGEWTTLDLICYEDKSLHIVNGKVVMILQNSRCSLDGKKQALKKGKIQIQCEASEVFYKDIKITNLESLPVEYIPYYQ